MDSSSSTLLHPPSSTSAPTSQHPSASSTGPQIRSRITVVCAECKRLKLKCDRRAPCGSCTKRDTVVRCIYSPAAAEKVDLHSLHNRLIQVESIISMITSGQQPPAFQSSYPLSQPSSIATATTSSSSTSTSSFNLNFSSHHQPSHQHHHHYAPPQIHPSTNSITLSPQDFASIWLDGLDLGVSWLSPSLAQHQHQQQQAYPNGASAGYIKLEPSTIDVALSLSHNSAPAVIDVDNNTHFSRQASRPASPLNSTRHRRSQQPPAVQLLLPALSIYYPVPSISPPGTSPSSSSAFPHQPSTNALYLPQHQQPHYTKPQVTPALLALLPPLERCKRLLQKVHEVFRVRPIPFEPSSGNGGAWKGFESRCLTLLSGGMSEEKERERERKEKAKQAKRARQIYFGGLAGLQHDDAEMDDASSGTKNKAAEEQQNTASERQSLTFFATMCAVLAIGASYLLSSSSGGNDSGSTSNAIDTPAFLYALSQQALGVWDTHVSSTSGSGAGSSNSSAADEAERMDYLLACLVGVEYLMLSVSGEEREKEDGHPGASPVYSLVGKLVNAQRNMGLGRDTSSAFRKGKNGLGGPSTVAMSKRVEKERLKEEWRKMMLWQVMYCDLFTADALGHQPYIPSYSYSAKLPSCSSSPSSSEAPTVGVEQESEDEFQQSHDDMQHDGYDSSFNTRNPNSNPTRQRRRHQQQPQPHSTLHNPNGEREEEAYNYFGARYRLTQLTQTVKDRIAHPDCCCGYTLDQAAALEDDIRRWYAGLPASLRAATFSSASAFPAATASNSSSPSLSNPTLPKSPFHDLLPLHPNDTANGSGANFGADKAALAQSSELAVMVNLLVMKIYTPFLRHAASSTTAVNGAQPQSSSASTASVVGISAPASQATVHAAQAILRAGKILSSLSASRLDSNDSQEIILPSLFDYYPLDKAIFDAVVICAHVGLTGKAATFAFDAEVLLEDVYSGLELLSDMLAGNGMGSGLGDKQKRVVEVLYKRIQHRGGNANLLKRKHDQVDIAGSFGASPMYPSANEAAAGSNEETTTPGFDFMNPGAATQYQPTGLPIARQQQHASLMDTSSTSTSRSSIPPSASIPAGMFPQDHPQRSEQHKNELRSALTSVATVRAAARHADTEKLKEQNQQDQQREKEKGQGQKYSKKSHAYPSVGIRVRPGKEGSSTSSRSRQQSISGSTASGAAQQHSSLMATTVQQQQRPLADSVLTFQQQQKQKLQQQGMASAGDNEADVQRSRSSSFSHVHSQSQAELQQPAAMGYSSLPFGSMPPSNSDVMDSLHSKSFTVLDAGARQAQQQQVAPNQSPFTSRPFDQPHSTYDRAQQQSYDPSVTVSSSVPHTDGMSYGNTISGPFSPPGGPPSSTGSPFTSASVASSGHPPTPTFNAHLLTPPVFGPQPPAPPPTSSPTTYFLPPNFGGSYTRSPPSELSGHHRNVSDMGIDQTIIPSTPVYNKSQQQQHVGMYDMKPAIDTQSQHHHILQQQQHMQRQSMGPSSYEDQDMSGQLSMVMPPAPSWPPSGQQQQPSTQASQNYWDMGGEFRFHD